ncbi:MAG: HEAT repeat domain-containing protein [Phycisphaerales bacterium]
MPAPATPSPRARRRAAALQAARRALITIACACAAPTAITACSSPELTPSFDSPDPLERSLAADRATRRADEASIPDLIEMLASSDPAVRMIAIRSLEKLTDQTLGYDHAAPELQRKAAIDRWVTWWNQQPLQGDAAPDSTPSLSDQTPNARPEP